MGWSKVLKPFIGSAHIGKEPIVLGDCRKAKKCHHLTFLFYHIPLVSCPRQLLERGLGPKTFGRGLGCDYFVLFVSKHDIQVLRYQLKLSTFFFKAILNIPIFIYKSLPHTFISTIYPC